MERDYLQFSLLICVRPGKNVICLVELLGQPVEGLLEQLVGCIDFALGHNSMAASLSGNSIA